MDKGDAYKYLGLLQLKKINNLLALCIADKLILNRWKEQLEPKQNSVCTTKIHVILDKLYAN